MGKRNGNVRFSFSQAETEKVCVRQNYDSQRGVESAVTFSSTIWAPGLTVNVNTIMRSKHEEHKLDKIKYVLT